MARVLILTLHSGEAALSVLREQLAAQSFQQFEHQIISGLPNRAAHARLYRTIMRRAGEFELFVKLDADMTLRSEEALADAVAATASHPEAQHFAFRVWDHFTDEETLGVHIFRSGTAWADIDDDLFVDPDPPGVKQIVWDGPPAPFVDHGAFVSDFECFAFGVHKFLKVAQRNLDGARRREKAHKYFRHMRNCARIRDLYRQTRARRHMLGLAGIIWAMDHRTISVLSDKVALKDAFEREVLARESQWEDRVARLGTSLVSWRWALMRTLGPRRAFG